MELVECRGKGSHAELWYGDRATTLKDRRAEIGKGRAARHPPAGWPSAPRDLEGPIHALLAYPARISAVSMAIGW